MTFQDFMLKHNGKPWVEVESQWAIMQSDLDALRAFAEEILEDSYNYLETGIKFGLLDEGENPTPRLTGRPTSPNPSPEGDAPA